MSYNTLEKRRLEEYKRNLELVGTDKSSIDWNNNLPSVPFFLNENNSNIRNINIGYDPLKISKTNNEWFKKSSAMDDENKARGITKTVASTGYAITGNLLKGIGTIAEGASDLVKYGYSDIQSALGNKEKAKKIREQASTVNNFNNFIDYDDNIDENSVLGTRSNDIISGIGYQGGMLALQAIGVPWQLTAGVTSYGSGMSKAISEGATTKEAVIYSLGSSIAEIASEYISNGVKLPGTGKTLDKIIDAGTEKIKSQVVKDVSRFGLDVVGEGLEEIVSGVASNAIKYLTYMKDDEKSTLKNIAEGNAEYFKTDAWNDFINGVIVSAITGGSQRVNNLVKRKNSIVNQEETKKNTTDKETINKIDTIISNINSNINNNSNVNTNVDTITSQISEYETLKEQNKLTNEQEIELNELKNQLSAIQNQNTDTTTFIKEEANLPTVQDIVNQEKSSQSGINLPVYNQQSNINNSDKAILPTVNDFNNSNINIPTSDIKVDMTKINPEILNDIKGFKLGDPSIESYKGSYIKTMLNEVGIKVPTAMNYVTEVRPDMSFTTTKDLTRQQYSSISNALQKLKSIDVTSVNNANYSIPIGNYQFIRSNNSNINELRRSASMYLNNTAKTNNTIRLLENIIKDRNYIIRFNPNITNEQGVSVNGKISIENGKTVIELNPNADNYVEFLVIHEITHDIATKEMKELILDYAEQDPEFEKSLESLKERYKTDDVSDEVVADVCGELFGNREFIQSVVEKKPNIFKKILNNIRKLAEKIKGTGANEYVSFVEKLKTMWEEAYYSNQSNLTETKYMITGIKGTKNAIKNDSNNQFLNDNYNKALKYAENNIENEQIRKKTGWFQDSKGDWKFEISDEDAKIIKKLEKNNTYRLEEILEHNDLYEMYPNLKNNKVKFTDFDIRIDENGKRYIKKGRVNNITNTISLNNELISKGNDAILDTLIHEIQHRIQKIEKFTQGTTSANGFENYQNNFGEKEARNTTERRKMNYETRLDKPPVSSLNNDKIDKNKNKWYSLNEVEQNVQEDNPISSQNLSENIYSRGKLGRNTKGQELDNSSFSFKQKQLNIIKKNNPVNDDYHTWIRNVEDIKTLEETINDSDWIDYDKYNPDLSRQDIENAIDSGKITVYSSYPIKQGIFVSPSKIEAESYSSNGKVYSKEVNINDVAWIDPTQGQYAKVYDILPTKYSQNAKEWNEYLKENFPSSGTKTKMSDIKLPVREDISKNFELDYTPQDPTKESTYDEPEKLAEILKEKPNTIEEKDNLLKKLATIKFIDKGYYVDKLARKVKNKELSSKYDYSLLSNGIANQIIGNGRVDEKGNKVGKGLYEIFEPIENSGLLDEFSNYIYHKHNIDRMSLQNRFNEANKAIFGDGMTSEMSEKIVNEYETKYPEFESWADDIYEYNNANLEMLVKYGVLSKDSMEYYNKKYPHYVPTIREQTKTKTQMDFLLGKKASVNNPIKKAKGGNGNIIPLKDAMALRTMQTVNSALRNNFGLELLNSIETEQIRNQENIDNIVEEINSDELLAKSSDTSPATLTVFDKGEKVTFDISDEIYEALKPSNIKTFKFLNKLNNIRRGLLTEYNPTFMITNPLKDIQDGSINSKHPKLFIKNLPEAIKQIKNNGQYKQLYIANGGSYETYFNYNTGTNIAPSKLDKIAPLKKISEINELIEMAPRLAEFISSIEAGDSIETAMYNASEITTNFKRGGDITKTLDRNGVTFLNAGVQGTTKQVRNVQEARVEGIKGITRLAVRWTIAGLVPTLLMNMIWGDDDDYEELSDYVKNNYYIIGKYDNGEFIRIPKGRVVSVLQSFFQNALNGVEGKKMDLKGFADLIENNLLPSDPNESSLIAPIKQAINNETWYGGDLVPTRLQNLPNAEQYDETTDSISIWLGKQLNISPYKINYVLDQYSGAIGDYILPYLTQEAESGSDSFTGKIIAPVKDKFTVDSTLKNQNISEFYSLSEELTKKSNSSNATDEDVLKNKYINSIKSDISKLYAEKREIQSSSSLKDSEKYNQSKELQKQINELSKTALNNYENIEITDNYAIVGNKEYYKNSNDEWTKIDTESPKYKIANLITKYNNYLKYNDEIKNIKNQYDNSNTRKNAVIKYVNSLDLTIPQKAMLIKMNYSSYNNYNNQIISYVNNQKISLDEKKEILEELGFKVRNGKVYTK